MAKLPKTIKIGSHVHKVTVVKNLRSKAGEEALGLYSYDDQRISIEESITPSRQAEVLLHEILHALYAYFDISKEGDKEETVVSRLAEGLATVFKDNPALIKYLEEVRK